MRSFSLFAVLSVFLTLPAFGQGERATVTGTVSDSTGAVIPGTAVSIRNTQTNVTLKTETNTVGIYYLPALPPGQYDVTAEKQGFRPARVSNLGLTVASPQPSI